MTGTKDAARAAEAVFLRARDGGATLGGAAWSCTVGAMCRARDVDRAADILEEMAEEPFMRAWPSCPTPVVPPAPAAEAKAEASGAGAETSAAAGTPGIEGTEPPATGDGDSDDDDETAAAAAAAKEEAAKAVKEAEEAAAAWAAEARTARKAVAERRAAAPAYAQMMHALCTAGRPAEALEVHRRMAATGC